MKSADLLKWQTLLSDNYVVLDFETDSHEAGGVGQLPENRLVLACWKHGPTGQLYYHFGGEFDQCALLDAITQADYIVGHNTKYELGWLRRMGVDLSTLRVACTQLAEHVLLGNLGVGDKHNPPRGLSLNACVTRRGWQQKDPVVDLMIKNDVLCSTIPRPWLRQRCAKDVLDTEALWQHQRRELLEAGKLPILWTRATVTSPFLAEVEAQAMCLDGEAVDAEVEGHRRLLAELETGFSQKYGSINWRSPPQVCNLLYGETDESYEGRCAAAAEATRNGEPPPERYLGLGFKPMEKNGQQIRSANKMVLAQLKAETKAQKAFLEERSRLSKIGSALSKSLEFYDGVVHERGGVFRGSLNQMTAATHRLSSTGIAQKFERYDTAKSAQFQNQPNAFKKLFRARQDGWLIGEWDGSQIEFRVAGHLSRDPQIREDVIAGHDVHRFSAAVIYLAPKEWLKNIGDHIADIQALMPDVTSEQRKKSKAHTFKPVYGGQSGSKREQAYYAAFRARYSRLAQTQETWALNVVKDKCLRTEWGLEFFWPTARMSHGGFINVGTSVYNYPVQCLATAEIVPIAACAFWHALKAQGLDKYIIPVNEVHDSVVCEVHPDYVEQFFQFSTQVWRFVYKYLREVYRIEEFFVPLGTEVAVGPRWGGDPERVAKYTVWPNGEIVEEAA